MAKRFTDTDKWKKKFMKSLPSEYKLFWLFLIDECDNAGIWHVELEVAEARLGIKLSLEKIRGFFKERIVEFDGGNKMFIPDFVQFQYGSLSESNRAHLSVINSLKKYNLMEWAKPLTSPLQGAMDKDKDKEEVKDKESREVSESDPVGSEAVQDAARKSFNDGLWVENTCMAYSLSPDDLKKWMARYNASICNDVIYDFSDRVYKKMFGGWLSVQRSKGYSLDQVQVKKTTLKKI